MGSAKRSRSTVVTTEIATIRRSEWTAARFAPAWSPAPILRAISDVAPAPRPFPRPTSTIKRGETKPTAASASAPRPATQIALTRLYVDIRSMTTIMGPESFTIAFLGSPVSRATPRVAGPLRGLLLSAGSSCSSDI